MPRSVTLAPHSALWSGQAEALMADLRIAAPGMFTALHHIGSTAVPGLRAKPVIDLLGAVADLRAVDTARPMLEELGWRWRGENGVAGRRYLTRSDPHTGERTAHLHIHATGDAMIPWHLAFRDRLRADPTTAAAYEAEKSRCAALHPGDSAAYAACKKAWTDRVAKEAVLATKSQQRDQNDLRAAGASRGGARDAFNLRHSIDAPRKPTADSS